MQIITQKIAPCLWFNTQAEEAATFYVSVFKNSKIIKVARYPNEGQDVHGKEAASVMAVDFEIAGQKFAALNGGPQFTFDEAVSFQIYCENQTEVDYFWNRLTEGGQERPCGWLKDKYGLSWQVVSGRALADDGGSRREKVGAGDGGLPTDEKVRHRDAETCL